MDFEKQLGFTFNCFIVCKLGKLNLATYIDTGGYPGRMLPLLKECYNDERSIQYMLDLGFLYRLERPELINTENPWFLTDEEDFDKKKEYGFDPDQNDFYYYWNGEKWGYGLGGEEKWNFDT